MNNQLNQLDRLINILEHYLNSKTSHVIPTKLSKNRDIVFLLIFRGFPLLPLQNEYLNHLHCNQATKLPSLKSSCHVIFH